MTELSYYPTSMGKHRQVLLYLKDLELMKTHANPSVWECKILHNMKLFCGKSYDSKFVCFGGNLGIFFQVHEK